jgi:hypothetical protein
VLWLIRKMRASTLARLNATLESRRLRLFQIDVMPFAGAIPRSATKVSAIAAGIVAVYLWLSFALVQFPYTAPWGRGLGRFLREILVELGSGALSALPGLFTVLVIVVLTRITTRSVSGLFKSVERGHIRLGWLEPETAKATRRLVIVVIWLFALTVAYPYIPGSQSDEF